MILPDAAIRRALDAGEISVVPAVSAGDIRAAGLRVHLAPDLLIPSSGDDEIDLAAPSPGHFLSHRMDADGFLLESHGFVLAATSEKIHASPGILCRLDGRSSIARSGLFVHCSSTTLDNIHETARAVVLELYNCNRRPVRLRPGLAIGMILFEQLDGDIKQRPSVQYADQQQLTSPRPNLLL